MMMRGEDLCGRICVYTQVVAAALLASWGGFLLAPPAAAWASRCLARPPALRAPGPPLFALLGAGAAVAAAGLARRMAARGPPQTPR